MVDLIHDRLHHSEDHPVDVVISRTSVVTRSRIVAMKLCDGAARDKQGPLGCLISRYQINYCTQSGCTLIKPLPVRVQGRLMGGNGGER